MEWEPRQGPVSNPKLSIVQPGNTTSRDREIKLMGCGENGKSVPGARRWCDRTRMLVEARQLLESKKDGKRTVQKVLLYNNQNGELEQELVLEDVCI